MNKQVIEKEKQRKKFLVKHPHTMEKILGRYKNAKDRVVFGFDELRTN